VLRVPAGRCGTGCIGGAAAPQPAAGGLDIGFVKRRSPSTDETLFLPMTVSQTLRPTPRLVLPALSLLTFSKLGPTTRRKQFSDRLGGATIKLSRLKSTFVSGRTQSQGGINLAAVFVP
jgi:hypothetical protein